MSVIGIITVKLLQKVDVMDELSTVTLILLYLLCEFMNDDIFSSFK